MIFGYFLNACVCVCVCAVVEDRKKKGAAKAKAKNSAKRNAIVPRIPEIIEPLSRDPPSTDPQHIQEWEGRHNNFSHQFNLQILLRRHVREIDIYRMFIPSRNPITVLLEVVIPYLVSLFIMTFPTSVVQEEFASLSMMLILMPMPMLMIYRNSFEGGIAKLLHRYSPTLCHLQLPIAASRMDWTISDMSFSKLPKSIFWLTLLLVCEQASLSFS